MNSETIDRILTSKGLPKSKSVRQIDVGFTNSVYLVNDDLIVKVCQDISNEIPFMCEVKLYEYYHSKLPVPQLIAYDDSKSVIQSNFMVYKKIHGENLYNVWHTLSDLQRRGLVEQLCNMLKVINNTDIKSLPKGINFDSVNSWKDVVLGKIEESLSVVGRSGTLSDDVIASIRQFVSSKSSCLDEQVITLVYWDAHFDNILVAGDRIVGLLDFERTGLASIDFALDIVKRMVEQPKKYMSEHAEQYARDEDYKNLMVWYNEFYPELFEFDNLNLRLDLYSIAHDLKDLEGWPNVRSLKDNLQAIVSNY